MKPDWKDAPEWAQWLARDPDGEWWWHEGKPQKGHPETGWTSEGQLRRARYRGDFGPCEPRP